MTLVSGRVSSGILVNAQNGVTGALALCYALVFAVPAMGGVQPGDVLVNDFLGAVHHFRQDGTFVGTLFTTGNRTEGVAVTQDGSIVTAHREPQPGITLFSSVGVETTFDTPTVAFPGDFSLLSDGSFAINDQTGPSVEIYSSAGSFVSSIPIPLQDIPNVGGSDVDSLDTLWITLTSSQQVYQFNKSGQVLRQFKTSFSPGDIVVDPLDSSLWIPDARSDKLYHLTGDGTLIGSFATAVTPGFVNFQGVAISPDRTLYVTGSQSNSVFRYTTNGSLIGSYVLPLGASPLYLEVVTVPEPSTVVLLLIVSTSGMVRRRRSPLAQSHPVEGEGKRKEEIAWICGYRLAHHKIGPAALPSGAGVIGPHSPCVS